MEYIPDFVARKHGRQAITYDLDACQEYLEETYGITVYQEQVMLLSQNLQASRRARPTAFGRRWARRRRTSSTR